MHMREWVRYFPVVLIRCCNCWRPEVLAMCIGCMLFFFPFLLFSDDSFVVQVPGVNDDGVTVALEFLLLLDRHAWSLLFSWFVLCGIGCYMMSCSCVSLKTLNHILCWDFEDGDMDGEGDYKCGEWGILRWCSLLLSVSFFYRRLWKKNWNWFFFLRMNAEVMKVDVGMVMEWWCRGAILLT